MIVQRLFERAISGDASPTGVEFARFLSRLDPEAPDMVLAAGYLVACAIEDAHTCIELNPQSLAGYVEEKCPLIKELFDTVHIQRFQECLTSETSRLIGRTGQDRPLIVCNNRLYINSYHAAEKRLDKRIKSMASRQFHLSKQVFELAAHIFPKGGVFPDWQKLAALNGCRLGFSVISGGPGTGKTRTVAALMALMVQAWPNETPEIALCAPTGKAVARLNESICSALSRLEIPGEILKHLPDIARTVHRLLGRGRNAATYRHNSENPLYYDVIIVDEASMLNLTLMDRLLDAMKPDTRLVLIGDKDQLASVEAGSVLADICNAASGDYSQGFKEMAQKAEQDICGCQADKPPSPLSDCLVTLRHNYRFGHDSGIYRLAQAVNRGDAEEAENTFENTMFEDVEFISTALRPVDRFLIEELGRFVEEIKRCDSPDKALECLDAVKVICSVHDGPFGTKAVNEFVSRHFFRSSASRPFHGLPVIIRQNDYQLGLYNGDSGIIWRDSNRHLRGYFMVSGKLEGFSITRLPRFEPAWAITVHVSQGSEFNKVLFLLPKNDSVVAGRELFYTAITRAKKNISVYGTKNAMRYCIKRPTLRMSGL